MLTIIPFMGPYLNTSIIILIMYIDILLICILQTSFYAKYSNTNKKLSLNSLIHKL